MPELNLFDQIDLSTYEKIGNLTSESHSSVKSTKHFPLYFIDGKTMIFKPMSKTKPLTTPFFSYSEVFWSYVINKYFSSSAPRYYLALGKEGDLEEKYYEKGVLVEKLNSNCEELINLYDFLERYKQDDIDIHDYVNYCIKTYDYTSILNSNFIKKNPDIGKDIAFQVLLSILRMDQNFHYENINFILKDDSISVAPPIDFEFSNFFLYPDDRKKYESERDSYFLNMNIPEENDLDRKIYKMLCKEAGLETDINRKNIIFIVEHYKELVEDFIKCLDLFIDELKDIKIEDNYDYIGDLNSDSWKAHKKLIEKIELVSVDKNKIFEEIISEIYEYSLKYRLILKTYLLAHQIGYTNLEDMTLNDLMERFNIEETGKIDDINLDNMRLLLSK